MVEDQWWRRSTGGIAPNVGLVATGVLKLPSCELMRPVYVAGGCFLFFDQGCIYRKEKKKILSIPKIDTCQCDRHLVIGLLVSEPSRDKEVGRKNGVRGCTVHRYR